MTQVTAFGDNARQVNVKLRRGYAHELLDMSRAVSITAQDGTVFDSPDMSLLRGYLTTGAA